jgi:hypothetical protein
MIDVLLPHLPRRYFAEPRVHLGGSAEIDIGTFGEEEAGSSRTGLGLGNGAGGGVATAVWSPPRPTLSVAADLPAEAAYELRVYDQEAGSRLVAAVEIVSPANKDRPKKRRAFIAKCAALLQEQVSLIIVDVVTTRQFNLYAGLLEFAELSDPLLTPEAPATYAVACRGTRKDQAWLLETWLHPLVIGQPLPTLPLWLAEDLAVPLELEASYEESCRALRVE